MKSVSCLSASVRMVCLHTSTCFPLSRGLLFCSSADRCCGLEKTPRPGVLSFLSTQVNPAAVQQVSAAPPIRFPPRPGKVEDELLDRHLLQKPAARASQNLSPYRPSSRPPSRAAPVRIQSLCEGDVVPELCSRLADLPSDDRAEGLAALLGACVESGLDGQNSLVQRLISECMELLSLKDLGVAQLCRLGEVSYALKGHGSAVLAEVLNSIDVAVEEDDVPPDQAARVYSLLTLCHDPGNLQQMSTLSTLHRRTERMVHRLKARQVSEILQVLLKLQERQAISLVLRLSHRASQVFRAFRDHEVIKVLSALMILGQHDVKLLAAMEKNLPGRLGRCDPELISTVMEYCLQMRVRSEPLFEAVAENFVLHAESHSTPQIAKQIVAMGRLSFLPQCSTQMFKKLETILSTRFSHFAPRSLIEVLHACIHLERFPLNHLSRVFSPFFLQRLQAQGEPLDRDVLGQLTQLHLSTSLECTHFRGPKLPYAFHVKRLCSADLASETPTDGLFQRRVKRSLKQLLGGNFYSTRTLSPTGYIIDVEMCLDENGYVLLPSEWEQNERRVALCLDGQSRFCSNTPTLLGREATKRRHLLKMGYEVVQIPYFEFERLRSLEEQVKYLHDKIFSTISKFTH
ncbi:FAST kinase domain-containing protein 3%2C mitochondrial-like [Xyrichtys novacula]|uniref:FAST kinase domain-containing protein 3, mitochondrial-like n=1 Tax=Xyrichtys novacula TaxID=13765 RepID=A0AAV1GGQ0_XYRNO|nr:FAST kinase domain-containing protein 3%2C mitochondrial-like [Xyrichtys novacula]